MSVTYIKYLQRLYTDKNYIKQNEEVNLFKKFLISNPEIGTTSKGSGNGNGNENEVAICSGNICDVGTVEDGDTERGTKRVSTECAVICNGNICNVDTVKDSDTEGGTKGVTVEDCKKTLTCDEFQTGKSGTIINMRNFLIFGYVDDFWKNIQHINDILFPYGKPDTKSFEAETTTDKLLKQFQNNRLLADTFEQIQKVDIKNIKNVGQLLESETFKEIVEKLTTSFSDGTYNMEDVSSLTTVMTSVVENLSESNSLNEKTKDNLKVVSEALGCMQNKKEFDINRLLGVIGSIDLPN